MTTYNHTKIENGDSRGNDAEIWNDPLSSLDAAIGNPSTVTSIVGTGAYGKIKTLNDRIDNIGSISGSPNAEVTAARTSINGAADYLDSLTKAVRYAGVNVHNVLAYGALGDGSGDTVAEWLTGGSYDRGYADLAAIQVDYPHVSALTDSIDWAATQAALDAAEAATRGVVVMPDTGSAYRFNRTLYIDDYVSWIGNGKPVLEWFDIETKNGSDRTITNITGSGSTVTVDYSGSSLYTGQFVTISGTTAYNESTKVRVTRVDSNTFTISSTNTGTAETSGTINVKASIAVACGMTERWSGRMENLIFNYVSGYDPGHVVNLLNVEDVEICNCQWIGYTFGTPIKGAATTGYTITDADTYRRRIKIYNNIMRMAAAESSNNQEGISISSPDASAGNWAEDVEVYSNLVTGGGDDVIAMHGVTDANVHDNRCSGNLGRIYMTDCFYFKVARNTHAHTASGTSMINCEWEAASGSRGCQFGEITENTLKIPSGIATSYAIYLRGCHDIDVKNNKIVNEGTATISGVLLNYVNHASADRKYGRINVDNNYIYGGNVGVLNGGTSYRDGWIKVRGNVCDGASDTYNALVTFTSAGTFEGDEITPGGIYNSLKAALGLWDSPGYAFSGVTQLGVWTLDSLPSDASLHDMSIGGIATIKVPSKFVITEFIATLSSAISSGTVTFQINKDGSKWTDFTMTSANGISRRVVSDTLDGESGTPFKNFVHVVHDADSTFGVQVNPGTAAGGGKNASVEIWGFWMR